MKVLSVAVTVALSQKCNPNENPDFRQCQSTAGDSYYSCLARCPIQDMTCIAECNRQYDIDVANCPCMETVHQVAHAMAIHVPVNRSLPLSVIWKMAQLEPYCWLNKIAMAMLVLRSVDRSSVLMRPTVRLIITGSMFIRMRQNVMQTAH